MRTYAVGNLIWDGLQYRIEIEIFREFGNERYLLASDTAESYPDALSEAKRRAHVDHLDGINLVS